MPHAIGYIDLSVAAQASLGAMVFALLCQKTSMPWLVALLICIAIAVDCGLINTVLVNLLRFPPFIATIGMASIYTGLCNVMTAGNNVNISASRAPGFLTLGNSKLFDRFPVAFLFAIALIIVYQFVLSKTTFGRSVYMSGGNANAARLSGLNPNRIRMILFINNGILATIGGLLWTADGSRRSGLLECVRTGLPARRGAGNRLRQHRTPQTGAPRKIS